MTVATWVNSDGFIIAVFPAAIAPIKGSNSVDKLMDQ